jgi:hypothetical protein
MTPQSYTRALGAVRLSLTCLLCACVGDSVVQPPKGGGVRNQPGSCATGALNSAWTNARLSGNRTLPVKCPYQVSYVNQGITLGAELFGPKETTSLNGSATLGPVRSTLDNWTVAASQSQYWGDDPNNSSGRRLVFNVNYQGGHIPAGGPGPWSHDSGTVIVDGTVYGQAHAYLTLSGSALTAPGYLVVPGQVVAGIPSQLRAVTDVDTNSYTFSWNVDGTGVAYNDARLTTTFATPGTHQVTAYATNAAGGVQTISSTVSVALNVSFGGSSSAKPGASVTYSAIIGSGGTAPFSYQWLLNGGQVGTGSTYRYTFGAHCTATLQLNVTDAAGHSGSNSSDLYLIDPNC